LLFFFQLAKDNSQYGKNIELFVSDLFNIAIVSITDNQTSQKARKGNQVSCGISVLLVSFASEFGYLIYRPTLSLQHVH
jgi:hypothetical protein